jgi:3-mercaptopyruvate sulfurtransferase SseA
MYKTVEYSEIDKYTDEEGYILIDVRSPGEFKNAKYPAR